MDAFYFGGTFIDKWSLRTSLLYYPSVMHYDVKSFFKQFYDTDEEIRAVIDRFYDDTQVLRQEGALKLLDLESWVGKYGGAFEALTGRYFLKRDPMLNKLVNSSKAPRLVVVYQYGKAISAFPEPSASSEKTGFGAQEVHYSDEDAYSFSPSHWYGFDLKEYVTLSVAREVAYGFLGAIEFDAAPFTDFDTYANFLEHMVYGLVNWRGRGVSGIYSGHVPHELPQILADAGMSPEAVEFVKGMIHKKHAKRNVIVRELARLELPNLSNVPDEELLAIRDKCGPSIEAFRAEMDNLCDCVVHESDFDSLRKQIKELVKLKISPTVADVEKALAQQSTEIRKKRVANVMGGGATLSANVFLPFEVLLLPLLLVGGKMVSDEINHLLSKIGSRRNSMHFVLRLKKASQPRVSA